MVALKEKELKNLSLVGMGNLEIFQTNREANQALVKKREVSRKVKNRELRA